jgi:hypothetical protein
MRGEPTVDSGAASRPNLLGRVRPGEWVLFAYLLTVVGLTLAEESLGWPDLHVLASTPDGVGAGRLWSLFSSALLAEGWMAPQVAATAVLGVAAIRLAGSRAFWGAAVTAHIAGTLLVYAGVWIADAVTPGAPRDLATLATQADFGISLVWCAALGVLTSVALRPSRPLSRRTRLFLGIAPPAALVVVSVLSEGLAFYEHIAAFALALLVALIARDRRSTGGLLRVIRSHRGSPA